MKRAWIWPAVWLLLLSCAAGASLQNQAEVKVEGIVTYLEPDQCYIEALDHSTGIWVLGPTGKVGLGDPAAARGTPGVIMGEPVVFDAHIHPHTGKKFAIEPIELSNIALGGVSGLYPWICDYIQYDEPIPIGCGVYVYGEWAPATGAYNVGLLVTTSGVVRSICESPINGAKWIYIDDDSGVVSDFGDKGVLVYTDAELLMGDTVSVTGISSVEPSLDDSTRLVRVIRTRDVGDVEVLAHQQGLIVPFSDEFDSPELDLRWIVRPGRGTISTVIEPGCLALIEPSGMDYTTSFGLIQQAPGDWEMKARVRPVFPAGPSSDFGIHIFRLRNATSRPDWAFTSTAAIVRHSYVNGAWDGRIFLGASQEHIEMLSSTYYLRVKRQNGQMSSSVSFDGLDYVGEETAETGEGDFIMFALYRLSPTGDSVGYYIDYVRFTPISQPGGQQ